MTFNINQDVAVVSVFYLQDVADKRVSSQWVAKVVDCYRSPFGLFVSAELFIEIVIQCRKLTSQFHAFLFDSVDTECIAYHLDKSTSCSGWNDLIWSQPKRAFGLFKNLLHAADHLHCKLFLANVVVWLDNHLDKTPRSESAKRRVPANSFFLFFGSL